MTIVASFVQCLDLLCKARRRTPALASPLTRFTKISVEMLADQVVVVAQGPSLIVLNIGEPSMTLGLVARPQKLSRRLTPNAAIARPPQPFATALARPPTTPPAPGLTTGVDA